MTPPYRPEGLITGNEEPAAGGRTSDDPSGRPERPNRPAPARLGWRGAARFVWRQLTSMRVALMLLVLLAVVALPGSVIPQRTQDPQGYAQYVADHPDLARIFDRLQLFDVYTSVWFSAVYLLLTVSLVGCILPRTWAHLGAMRAAPPRAPRRFARMPAHTSVTATVPPAQTVARARSYLRGPRWWFPRYRVVTAQEPSGALTVSAERGYLRETGNLLFHLALVGLLCSVALGHLNQYRGQVLLTQGRTFVNAQTEYDSFSAGAWFDSANLTPFRLRLDQFDAVFRPSDAMAQDFTAHVSVLDPVAGSSADEIAEQAATIKVNHPLTIDGTKIYLQGNGYAPEVTVTDADGNVALSGPVPFIPDDEVYTSRGVIKVPDVTTGDQIGFVGYLLPTGDEVSPGLWRSVFPDLWEPVMVLTVWHGDLGLDTGVPQNVYRLDTSAMTQSQGEDGAPATIVLRPGESVELPDGLGSITFNGVSRYVALDLRRDPALAWVLGSAIAAFVGLALSLFVPRRRLWVRVTGAEIEVAGLARTDDGGLKPAVDHLAQALARPGQVMESSPPARDGSYAHTGEGHEGDEK